ncbi:MAG TPA: rhomboid family intramembrane serine protease [Woeseiaceae bacterium]
MSFKRPVNPGNAGGSQLPTVIFFLLIANGLIFALQQVASTFLGDNFALWPLGSEQIPFQFWQLVSYGFLHGDIMHLAFNMFALWMFGSDIERVLGARNFVIYYLTCVVGAALVQLVVAAVQGGDYSTIGASGGVFGILLAFGMIFPNRMVMLVIPPIPMKAKYLVILFGVMELYFGVTGREPGVANFAHLGGMAFGFMLLQRWKRPRRR